jgi:hypothetical protein
MRACFVHRGKYLLTKDIPGLNNNENAIQRSVVVISFTKEVILHLKALCEFIDGLPIV